LQWPAHDTDGGLNFPKTFERLANDPLLPPFFGAATYAFWNRSIQPNGGLPGVQASLLSDLDDNREYRIFTEATIIPKPMQPISGFCAMSPVAQGARG
jgi:hypothetical protein